MQISKLNSFTLPKTQAFKSCEGEACEKLLEDEKAWRKSSEKFAGLSDRELFSIAAEGPAQEFRNTSKKTSKVLIAVPIVDIAASGLLNKGDLSGKLNSSIKKTGQWGAVGLIALAFFLIKNSINNNFKTLDNADKKHPVLSFGTDLAVMFAGLFGLNKAYSSGKEYVKKTFPNGLKEIDSKLVQPLKTTLNKTYFNQKIIKPADNFLHKNTNGLGKAMGIFGTLLAPTILIASLLKLHSELKRQKQECVDNFNSLKVIQSIAKMDINET